MKLCYLSSSSTHTSHAAKALFEVPISVPQASPNQLEAVIQDAEQLFLAEGRIRLQIDGVDVDFRETVRNSNDREGVAILEDIASKLPRALSVGRDCRIAELANYEVAALISSPLFWNATEDALKQTLNRDSMAGDLHVERPSFVGMNITTAKDGKTLECHVTAAWAEVKQAGQWHCMTFGEPVMTANVKALIPLKKAGDNHRLQASFVKLHANSPLAAIRNKLMERKATLADALRNALARVLCMVRGTKIKVTVGEEFHGQGIAHAPTEAAARNWIGFNHQKHRADPLAACTHIVAKQLKDAPNWTRVLRFDPAYAGQADLPADQPAPLKALLDHRHAGLRTKANLIDAADAGAPVQEIPVRTGEPAPHNMPLPPGDIPPPPDGIPPIGPTVEGLQMQLQALQQTLEAEQRARQQADTDRDALSTETEKLRQQLATGQQQREKLEHKLDEANAKFVTAFNALSATHMQGVTLPRDANENTPPMPSVRERAQSYRAATQTQRATLSGNTTPAPGTTSTDNA